MGSRGFCRTFIVPAFTAGVIIWILFFAPGPWRHGEEEFSHPQGNHATPSTAHRSAPWTLSDDDRAFGRWTPVPATIPQRFAPASSQSEGLPDGLAVAPAPRHPVAAVALRAPLVLEETDLAGIMSLFPLNAKTVSLRDIKSSKSNASTSPSQTRFTKQSKPVGSNQWPATPEITRRLELLSKDPLSAKWAEAVSQKLERLQSKCHIGDTESTWLIEQLDELASTGLNAAEASSASWGQKSAWLQACYSLQRRTQVWSSVTSSRLNDPYQFVAKSHGIDLDLPKLVAEVRETATETGDVPGWTKFLLLDQIDKASQRADFEPRKLVAQRTLSRIDNYHLNQAQRKWVDSEAVQRLAIALRPWATEPMDLHSLLEEVEAYELTPDDRGAAKIAMAIQTLRYAEQPEVAEVAMKLNDHYRNANLRICLSTDMLERMIPAQEPQHAPVRQNILGADVRGQSVTETKMGIRLIPTSDAWRMLLATTGDSHTRTVSSSGPAHFRHQGLTQFQAETEIRVDRDGIVIHEPQVDVQATNRLRAVASDYDALPVIGPLVRSIALSQHNDSRGKANSIAERIAERQIASTIDQELHKAAGQAERTVVDRLIGPLAGMELHPMVVDLQNSDQRMQVRYRVASNYQLAASTPRPRAWSDSVFSLQMHESMLNNVLEQTLTSDKALPVAELWKRAAGPFGKPPPSDLPDNVKIAFSPTRPVVVHCDGNRVELTLNIVALQIEDRVFRNFSIHVVYRPEINGLNAKLVRDGVIQVSGEKLGTRDRLPIRVIFNKVFHEQRALPLLAAELAQDPRFADLKISQLETRDGWFAIALAPATTKIAARP